MSNEARNHAPDTTPFEGTASPIRLAVFKQDGAEKQPFAGIGFSKTDKGKSNIYLRPVSAEARQALTPLIEALSQKRNAEPAGTIHQPLHTVLADELIRAGYIVEELPEGDFSLKIEMDTRTGRILGTNTPLHGLVSGDNDLGRKIMESITTAFSAEFDNLANEIETHVAANEHADAVTEIRDFIASGKPALTPTKRFFDALNSIDLTKLSLEDKKFARLLRFEIAYKLKFIDVAAQEAATLLKEHADLEPNERANLKMASVLGTKSKQNPESTLSVLKGLLKEPSDLNADGRGWAWRNIAMALGEDHPETKQACRNSADAFLVAGDKENAVRSLMGAAKIAMTEDPHEAVKSLDEIVEIFTTEQLADRYAKGAVYHARGNCLAKVHRHDAAYEDAAKAVELQRGLIGVEEAFVSTLHLAAIESRYLGENDRAEKYEAEAGKLTAEAGITHFQFAKRLESLFQNFDLAAAKQLADEAKADQNWDIYAGVQIAVANNDKSLSDDERLQLLEETLNDLQIQNRQTQMIQPVQMSIAGHLHHAGDFDRAAVWYRRVLDDSPIDVPACSGLVDCLWKKGLWPDAANFTRMQTKLNPNQPGIWWAYGKSLFEAQDYSGAVTALARTIKIIEQNPDLKTTRTDIEGIEKDARERLSKAIDLGGTIQPPPIPSAQTVIVSLEELRLALEDFAKNTAANRMRFWKRDGDGHEWVSSPEKIAQGNLGNFLSGRFGDRIELFDEIGAGAGRIDIYVQLRGGASVIIELKMCGGRYSSPYAAAGENQIIHYMDNKKTSVGYLVVFDGRKEKFGEPLLTGKDGRHTIKEILVDVYPVVGPRA